MDDSISTDSLGSLSMNEDILSDNESYMSAGRRESLKTMNTDY